VNVLMMTNTYLPHVGGVARSVASCTEELRRQGHRVVVVAPTYARLPDGEVDVYRVPAIANFNGSEFSLRLPVPVVLSTAFPDFEPDVVHAHHPFLLGDTALRAASVRKVPLVFTHHTMYEQYTHYLPATSEAVKNFAVHLPTGYANLCDHVIAPSASLAAVLRERGVEAPITPIPTGIDPKLFAEGDGGAAREKYGIPKGAFVVGHVGRLAPEKNLGFLARAVASFVRARPEAHFLVVGGGPAEADVRAAFAEAGAAGRLHLTGPLQGQALADAYHAMDVFAFASKTETQGMVLAEAMTAGVPVVALGAPGARDVVADGQNGRLLKDEEPAAFAAALAELADVPQRRRQLAEGARATAEEWALERCAGRLLDVYAQLVGANLRQREEGHGAWGKVLRLLEAEWGIWSARFDAAFKAINEAW
jgi:glycosyltransferase involved in cell wall biosynthesis